MTIAQLDAALDEIEARRLALREQAQAVMAIRNRKMTEEAAPRKRANGVQSVKALPASVGAVVKGK